MSVIDPGEQPVAPPEPAAPAAPWAADAAAYFGENTEAIAAFDRYQREKAQPYITQLEQRDADARELWADLNENPAQTMRDLFASVYVENPDTISAFDAIFAETPADPVEPVAAPPTDEIPEWAKPLVESHQQRVDRELAEAQAASYTEFKDELKSTHDLTDEDVALIDPFIYGSPSDPDAAVAAYKAWRAKALGETPPPVADPPVAPPVLGVDGTVAAPPASPQYTSYDQVGEAIQNFFSRQGPSSTPPPIVG